MAPSEGILSQRDLRFAGRWREWGGGRQSAVLVLLAEEEKGTFLLFGELVFFLILQYAQFESGLLQFENE